MNQLNVLLPELTLTIGIVVILLGDLFLKEKKWLSWVSILFFTLALIGLPPLENRMIGPVFNGQVQIDLLANVFRILLLMTGIITVWFSHGNPELKEMLWGEYHLLLMGSILGGMLMTISSNLIMVYLSIEFVSILSYLLTAFKIRDSKASEAAIKYILYGAVSSGVMLFGLSYLYGIGGSLELKHLGKFLNVSSPVKQIYFLGGIGMVLAGLGYKMAVAPFHAWCPDVYEGAATPVTTFLSVAPKIAAFALLIRFLNNLFPFSQSQLQSQDIIMTIAFISGFTMTFGNLAAIPQNNVKRLLAYSSIAHAGYILSAFAAYSTLTNQAVLVYLFAYLLMNVGAFLTLMAVGGRSANMIISSFNGLAYRGRSGALWATVMTVFLVSLVGLPPMVGFIGKYYVFSALVEKQIYWLAILGALNSVVSLYYYARILKAMFFGHAEGEENKLFSPLSYEILGVLLAVLTLVLGIYPQLIIYTSRLG